MSDNGNNSIVAMRAHPVDVWFELPTLALHTGEGNLRRFMIFLLFLFCEMVEILASCFGPLPNVSEILSWKSMFYSLAVIHINYSNQQRESDLPLKLL